MKIFLKIIRWCTAFGLLLSLFVTIVVGLPVSITAKKISNKENVKTWLQQANFYESVSDAIINQVLGEEEIENNNFLHGTARKIITPAMLEQNTHIIIDSYYAWLSGETSEPQFALNIFSDKQKTQQMLVDELPECPPEVDCLGMVEQEFDGFFETTTISSDSMAINYNSLQFFSGTLVVLKYMYLFVLGLIVLQIIFTTLLIPGLKKNLIITSIVTIFSGFLLLTTRFLLDYTFDIGFNVLFNSIALPLDGLIVYKDIIVDLMKVIYTDVLNETAIYSLILIVLSIIMFVLGIIVKKDKSKKRLNNY